MFSVVLFVEFFEVYCFEIFLNSNHGGGEEIHSQLSRWSTARGPAPGFAQGNPLRGGLVSLFYSLIVPGSWNKRGWNLSQHFLIQTKIIWRRLKHPVLKKHTKQHKYSNQPHTSNATKEWLTNLVTKLIIF